MTGLEWKLEDDRTTITLTLPTSPPVSFELDTSYVDDML
jgi:hypothetical protein